MGIQLKRAGQLGLLARDLASAKCRKRGADRDQVLRRIVDRVGLMHGVPQKIGQLLAFSELDQSDPAFTRLTENSTTLPTHEAFAAIERQLGRPVQDCFRSIDPEGISASIGQVHRATLHDGRDVAVKVQYPEIAEQIGLDLRALGWLTAPIGDLRRGFDMAAYREEIGSMIESELDYQREAELLQQFANRTNGWPTLVLPQVVPEFSTKRILTTTWLTGQRLSDTRRWTEGQRRTAAETILRLFLTGTFQWRCIHADPHPGNYRFQLEDQEAKVGLLDFGCVKKIPAGLASGLSGLIRDTIAGLTEGGRVFDRFLEMGFGETLLEPLRELLPEVAQTLCEPFTTKGLVRTAQWKPGERLARILGPHRMAFRLAGPPEILFFLRAFQGVVHYLNLLDAPVAWREIWDEAKPAPSASAAPEPRPEPPSVPHPMKSSSLHIQVREASETKVSMTFSAAATDSLPGLVPLELHEKLRVRAINLENVVADARRRDYAPGDLFSFDDGTKQVRVWLA